MALFLLGLSTQFACSFNQHQPDPATVLASEHCDAINGRYRVASVADGEELAESLLKEEAALAALTVLKGDIEVTFQGAVDGESEPPAAHFVRFTCADSILRLVLDDSYSGNGLAMAASDRVAELFVTHDAALNVRLISTTLAFFFIIPYYGSNDRLIVLERLPDDSLKVN